MKALRVGMTLSFLVLTGCGSGGGDATSTLAFSAAYDQEKVVDTPPQGPSLGDHQAFSGTMRDEAGTSAGHFGGTCTWVGVSGEHVLEHCSAWAELERGMIVSEGMSRDDATDVVWAVTGGTDAYEGAQGVVRIRPVSSGLDVVFEVTTPVR